jgi:proline dehydrogenase
MLRSFLIYLSKAAWARHAVTRWPVAWRAASRFIAGEKLADGIRVVQSLNERGILATLDHLGEHTTTREEAVQATQAILEMLDAIQKSGVRANVSLKLTQLGLALDPDFCADQLQRILTYARERDNFVRIDMEEATWTDITLEIYQRMRDVYHLDNTGVVIQAYLFRSEEDVRRIAGSGGRIRLCKGAYKEPPEIAYPRKQDVDANYDRLAEIMMEAAARSGAAPARPDGKFPPIPAIATHDPKRIEHAKNAARRIGLPNNAVEFQMLYGIRRDLQEELVREGYPVRVYVPYGREWYPYYVRRLAERPANLWFFITNFFRK